MNNRIVLFVSAVCLLIASTSIAAHPYHVSLTEIEWNSKSKSFEVAVCLWPADLEKALAMQEKESVDLDKTKNLEGLIAAYVAKKIVCSSGERVAPLRWVGFETNNKEAWIYFELKPVKNDAESERGIWKFENRLFFELSDDQQNHINFVNGLKRSSSISTVSTPGIELKPGG